MPWCGERRALGYSQYAFQVANPPGQTAVDAQGAYRAVLAAGPQAQGLLRAVEKFNSLQIEWNFLGKKSNPEVKQYFEKNSVDVFINTSESEGVPVSIMEAMSYGVPVIAPNVGGVAELVSNDYGFLLSETASVTEIAMAIVEMAQKCKQTDVRMRAKNKIISDYDANHNYKNFIDLVIH